MDNYVKLSDNKQSVVNINKIRLIRASTWQGEYYLEIIYDNNYSIEFNYGTQQLRNTDKEYLDCILLDFK